ncbi:MAG: peptidylprolyl isomerase, partial [Patescibacteria group bacterium]
ATELGVRVTPEELETAFNDQKKQTKNFEATLKKLYGMSPQEFKQVIAERILKEKVKSVVITRIRVRHVLTSTLSAANEAYDRLAKGDTFEKVVTKYTQDNQTKKTGGDLGYWTQGELTAAVSTTFERAAFSLKLKKISKPVQTKFGYHLIQVTERSDKDFRTYADWYKATLANYQVKVYIPY